TSIFTATGTIQVNDAQAPSAPTGLSLDSIDSALMATWNASPEPDVTAYLLRWGQQHPGGFLVQNQQLVTAIETPTLRIGGLTNGMSYGVDIAAIDASGNTSAFAPALFKAADGTAAPIPLA